MASVPNARIAPSPIPAGKMPAPPADPAGFAQQLAGIPEELQIPAAVLPIGGDAPAPDGAEEDGGDTEVPRPADASSDAARLVALAPLLQSLPAIVAAPPAAPAAEPTPAAAGIVPPATSPAAAPQPAAAPETPKAETGAAKIPAPAAMPAPAAPVPAGKAGQAKPDPQAGKAVLVKPDAQPGKDGQAKPDAPAEEAGAGTEGASPATAIAAAREAIAAAKRAIRATLSGAKPAIVDAAKLVQTETRPVATAMRTTVDNRPAAPTIDIATAGADSAATAAFAMPAAPAQAAATSSQPREAAPAAPAPDRALDLANDAEWLDRLARDIAQASGNEGTIRFRLHPQTLGHLHVELSQSERGTSIRLTADTEQARAILVDAQPRLAAEARAQGVRIAETHVDLSGSDRNASADQRRQDEARQNPMIRTARGAAADAKAPERPGRSRSDRYA